MSSNQREYHETDPLLPRRDGEERQRPTLTGYVQEVSATQIPEEEDDRTTKQRIFMAIPCAALLMLLIVGSGMMNLPINEVSERIICRNMYGDVAELHKDSLCKGTAVQTELAFITGWEMTFDLAANLLTGIPFGLAADKYGRKAILFLANAGFVLSAVAALAICRYPDIFPLRLRWVAPIFSLIGGGAGTYLALIYTMVADITTQAQRSTAFFCLSTITTVGSLVASPLTYLVMTRGGDWTCIACGFSLMVVTLPITAMVPETRCEAVIKRARVAQKLASDEDEARSWWDLRPLFRSARQHFSLIISVLFTEKPTVGVLLFSLLFTVLGKSVAILLQQYVTKAFGWPWSKVAFMSTIKDSTSLLLTAIILPLISHYLLKTGMNALIKDWWIVRVSAVIGALGALGMGLAPTVTVFTCALVFSQLGSGLFPSLRSMLTEQIDQTHVALLMTVVSAFTNFSDLFAGPALAQLFHVGMELGGVWIGLPYLAAAVTLSLGALMVIFVPMRRYTRLQTTVALD